MKPDILAFDFDGVICNGLIEYFQTAWKAYCRVWNPMPQTPPEGLAERFYPLRPVVETGWEMPVLLRSLLVGTAEDDILADWQAIAHQRVQAEGLDPKQLAQVVDRVRDEWIQESPEEWLAQHRFYPGVIERLRQSLQSMNSVFIISTKEGRFIQQLLHQETLELNPNHIYGKDVRQPKHETLRQLTQRYSNKHQKTPNVWFIEDRLNTLISIKGQSDLGHVRLFLADWGYNTEGDRTAAAQDDRIHLLSGSTFAQGFAAWIPG